MYPAFRSAAYRRFWTGAFVSNVGSWMHQTALGWLVYTLTDSTFWLGTATFVAMSPSLVFSLYGGVIADRTNRRRLLIAAQAVLMLSACTLGVLTAGGIVTLGHILVLSLVSGVALAISTPVYQTILHELVPPQHLMNAISLNSVQFNLARIVGPLGMGVVTPFVGIAGCFFVNTLTFLAMIATVSTLEIAAIGSSGAHSVWTELRNGVRYAWRTRMIRIPLLLAAALSLFGFPYIILLPAFARDILHLGAEQYGYLVAAPGAGAVIGGLALATFGDVRRKGVLACVTALVFSVAIVGFSFSTDLSMAQIFLFLAGMHMVSAISTINTLLQLTTADRVRGRVMSMFSFALFGLAPIGSFHLGTWAHYVGTPRALAGGGIVCFLVAASFLAFARDLRQPVASPRISGP